MCTEMYIGVPVRSAVTYPYCDHSPTATQSKLPTVRQYERLVKSDPTLATMPSHQRTSLSMIITIILVLLMIPLITPMMNIVRRGKRTYCCCCSSIKVFLWKKVSSSWVGADFFQIGFNINDMNKLASWQMRQLSPKSENITDPPTASKNQFWDLTCVLYK